MKEDNARVAKEEAGSKAEKNSASWDAWLLNAVFCEQEDHRHATWAQAQDWLEKNAATPQEKELLSLLSHDEIVLSINLVEGFLACGARPTLADEQGNTVFHRALFDAYAVDCCRALLPHCDLLSTDSAGMTPLMWMAHAGENDLVKKILAGSDPRAVDQGGMNALMWAANNGNTEGVKLLLPHSDPKASSNVGMTALMFAAAQQELAKCVRE